MPGIINFVELHVDRKSQLGSLWIDIHKVGLGLEGDVLLEKLLGHAWIKGNDLLAKHLEH